MNATFARFNGPQHVSGWGKVTDTLDLNTQRGMVMTFVEPGLRVSWKNKVVVFPYSNFKCIIEAPEIHVEEVPLSSKGKKSKE